MLLRWAWLYWAFRWGEWAAIGLIVVTGATGLVPIEFVGWPKTAPLHRWIHEQSIWITTVLSLVAGACAAFAHRIGSPRMLQILQGILADLQRTTFCNLDGDQTGEHHRVTLYRWQQWCLFPGFRESIFWPWGPRNSPWSGWLVPVVRAGPYTRPKTVFLAKGGGKGEFEGVAGATYFSQAGFLDISELPDVYNSSPEDVRNYATQAHVPIEWLEKRMNRNRPCARCFRSIRIEVDGVWWGVLMIDSRETKLPSPQTTRQRFDTIANVFTVLLRGS